MAYNYLPNEELRLRVKESYLVKNAQSEKLSALAGVEFEEVLVGGCGFV